KLLSFLYYLNDFVLINFLLPVITPLCLVLILIDKFKTAVKREDFWLACFFVAAAYVTAAVLVFVPLRPPRVFYGSCIFSILAFVFLIKLIFEEYGCNLSRLLCPAALMAACFLAVPFCYSYFSLYAQNARRERSISRAIEQGARRVYLPAFYVFKGPAQNLTITFFDPVVRGKYLSKRKGIETINAFSPEGFQPGGKYTAPVI
ncbi:MAG: DUF6056 family protein, partial [Elusimicrobiota bacterium]|nr:DUF6056 family protein [Elusimicrobiota bacterium]